MAGSGHRRGGEASSRGDTMPHVKPLSREALAKYEPFFQVAEQMMGGFVPNSLFTMGHRPEILEAFMLLAGTVNGPGCGRFRAEAVGCVRREQRRRMPVAARPTLPRTRRTLASRPRRSSTPSSSRFILSSPTPSERHYASRATRRCYRISSRRSTSTNYASTSKSLRSSSWSPSAPSSASSTAGTTPCRPSSKASRWPSPDSTSPTPVGTSASTG